MHLTLEQKEQLRAETASRVVAALHSNVKNYPESGEEDREFKILFGLFSQLAVAQADSLIKELEK